MTHTMTRSRTTDTMGAPNTPYGSPGGGRGGNNGPEAPEAVPAAGSNIFGLTPVSVQSRNIINYSSSQGIKLYHVAAAALKTMYHLESGNVNQANEALMQRASESAWDATGADILNIPDSNGAHCNVISEYGLLSAHDIRDHVSTYHTRQTRQAQNGVQMGQCLLNSMTEAGKLKIMKESDAYFVDGILYGTLLLKLILKNAIIDSRATSANLREQLTTLDSYMASVDCNIELFNQHIKEVVSGLRERGESTDELIVKLFKAYCVVGDSELYRYMKNKRGSYDGGEDVQADLFLSVTLAKSQSLIDSGVWNMMSPDQERLVALLSKVNMLKDRKLKLSKDTQGGIKGKKPEDKGKFKRGLKPSNNISGEDKWAWKKVPPQAGEPKTKHMPGFD
jgi:hypothetical protein